MRSIYRGNICMQFMTGLWRQNTKRILTGSWLGSSESTNVLMCVSLATLCCTLFPWHITVRTRALKTCRQWWVQCRSLAEGVHLCRVPIKRACVVIASCKIPMIMLGSVFIRTSSGVRSLSQTDEDEVGPSQFIMSSIKLVSRCPSGLRIERKLRILSWCVIARILHEDCRCRLGLPRTVLGLPLRILSSWLWIGALSITFAWPAKGPLPRNLCGVSSSSYSQGW